MRFSHKLKKLTDPRILRSMRQHLGLMLLSRRFIFSVNERAIVASMDEKGFREIYERYRVKDPGSHWPKYLDLDTWIAINLRRVHELELDWGRRRHILDIGAGAGYFLYICKWLGHDPLALDIDEVPMFREMTVMLGLPRVIWRVNAFETLPTFPHQFDVITAFMICFNGHKSPALWGPQEWEFFLNDLETRLKPGGRIRLGFNREFDDQPFNQELRDYFLGRGAEIEDDRVTLRKEWLATSKSKSVPVLSRPTAASA